MRPPNKKHGQKKKKTFNRADFGSREQHAQLFPSAGANAVNIKEPNGNETQQKQRTRRHRRGSKRRARLLEKRREQRATVYDNGNVVYKPGDRVYAKWGDTWWKAKILSISLHIEAKNTQEESLRAKNNEAHAESNRIKSKYATEELQQETEKKAEDKEKLEQQTQPEFAGQRTCDNFDCTLTG
ncbi:Oidioi.mRNA.OKI2018_I69.PAR.g8952.t1.cds [Oikopleura dioica]|uniref:Oidioi.mRNA.OKI2018_I69.PAR.g8952.t1.cds n=1 Tax=Oikopleura dioica TaxID=34765 RepID=A0ABN7RME5_OIKDI|nr:Oidioi.mRNA.OKI2018_I69.PAR.g8952.t1.cds [Oikopleura dioica]